MVNRLSLATENTVLFFLPSLAVALVYGYFGLEGPVGIRLAVVAAVPAASCLVVTLLILAVPALAAYGRYSVSSCVMLPLVHLSVTVALVTLVTTGPSALMRMPAELQPVLMWLTPGPLILSFLGEFVFFALAHLRGARPEV